MAAAFTRRSTQARTKRDTIQRRREALKAQSDLTEIQRRRETMQRDSMARARLQSERGPLSHPGAQSNAVVTLTHTSAHDGFGSAVTESDDETESDEDFLAHTSRDVRHNSNIYSTRPVAQGRSSSRNAGSDDAEWVEHSVQARGPPPPSPIRRGREWKAGTLTSPAECRAGAPQPLTLLSPESALLVLAGHDPFPAAASPSNGQPLETSSSASWWKRPTGVRSYRRVLDVSSNEGVHEELRLGVSDSERHKLLHLVPNELIATLQGPDEQGWCKGYAVLRPGRVAWFSEHFCKEVTTAELTAAERQLAKQAVSERAALSPQAQPSPLHRAWTAEEELTNAVSSPTWHVPLGVRSFRRVIEGLADVHGEATVGVESAEQHKLLTLSSCMLLATLQGPHDGWCVGYAVEQPHQVGWFSEHFAPQVEAKSLCVEERRAAEHAVADRAAVAAGGVPAGGHVGMSKGCGRRLPPEVRTYRRVQSGKLAMLHKDAAAGVSEHQKLIKLIPRMVLATLEGPDARGWCKGYCLDEPQRIAWFSEHFCKPVAPTELSTVEWRAATAAARTNEKVRATSSTAAGVSTPARGGSIHWDSPENGAMQHAPLPPALTVVEPTQKMRPHKRRGACCSSRTTG